MSEELLNYTEVNKIENKTKVQISKHHKIKCVCCNGTKIFQDNICPHCDNDGLIPMNKLDLFGIPVFLLN